MSRRRAMIATLWRLGWPVAITGQLAVLAEAVLIFWIARLLGPAALAVEATLRPVMQCATWILLAVATGVSVLVAQSVGARDRRGLGLIQTGMILVAIGWLVFAAILVPLAGPLSEALASAEVSAADLRSFGLPLLLVMVPGLAMLQVLLFAASGAGWTRLSLVRMLADLALGAAVVPVCVLAFGLAGAPLGQGATQLVMIALIWRALHRHRERWQLGDPPPRRALWNRARWLEVLDIGLPPQIARIAMFVAYSYLVQLVTRDGPAAVAGYGIAFTALFSAIAFCGAVGRAVGIVLGQSIGAGDPERGREVVRTGLVLSVGLGAALVIVLVGLAGWLPGLLVDDAAIEAEAARALRIVAWSLPFLATSQVFLFALTAIKASKRAGLLGIVADAVGVGFALAWPGDRFLDAAAWSICVSNAVRAALFAAVGSAVLARKLAAVQATSSTNSE